MVEGGDGEKGIRTFIYSHIDIDIYVCICNMHLLKRTLACDNKPIDKEYDRF